MSLTAITLFLLTFGVQALSLPVHELRHSVSDAQSAQSESVLSEECPLCVIAHTQAVEPTFAVALAPVPLPEEHAIPETSADPFDAPILHRLPRAPPLRG